MSEGEGLVAVTRQQFLEAMEKLGWEFNDPDADVFEDIDKAGLVVFRRADLEQNAKTTCDIAWPCGVCDSQGVQNCRVKTKNYLWVRFSEEARGICRKCIEKYGLDKKVLWFCPEGKSPKQCEEEEKQR